MAYSKGRIIKEIVLSSKNNCVRNGACLEFALNQELSFEGMGQVYVGMKNVVLPPQKRTMDIKMYFGHLLDKFDPSQLKSFSLNYSSYEDLCGQIQCCALSFLTVERQVVLDFRYANVSPSKTLFLSVTYRDGRIIFEQDIDYVLVVSRNVGEMIEFGNVDRQTYSGIEYYFLVGVMHISHIMYFEDEKNFVMHFSAFELIESCTRLPNGNHIPLLYTFDRRNSNETLDTVRLVSIRYFRNLKIIVMNNKFERFDFKNFDFENGGLSFSLIFFL